MKKGQIDTDKLDEREKILLDVIYSFSEALEYPTSAILHEYILLCRLKSKRKLPELRSYDFRAYMRGPFSEQVRNDLHILHALNLIEAERGRLAVTDRGKELIRQNRKGQNFQNVETACQEILSEFSTPHAISKGIYDSLGEISLGEAIRP